MSNTFETELSATRDEVAMVLRGVVDGITAGSIHFGSEEDAIVIAVPDEVTLEIELETEDDEVSLELELVWPHGKATVRESAVDTVDDIGEEDEGPVPVGAADSSETLAHFEIFRDTGDEWRWRLRHRNGNIIATSGEGYTRKYNAQKGLRSVIRNAPNAEITEDDME